MNDLISYLDSYRSALKTVQIKNDALPRLLILAHHTKTLHTLLEALRSHFLEIFAYTEKEAAEALLGHIPVDLILIEIPQNREKKFQSFQFIRQMFTQFPNISVIGVCPYKISKTELGYDALHPHPFTLLSIPDQLKKLVSKTLECLHTSPTRITGHARIHDMFSLDSLIAEAGIHAVLQPIVEFSYKNGHFRTLGLESLARPQMRTPLGSPEFLFNYAEKKERLFDLEIACIQAAFKEIQHIKTKVRLFINVCPRSLFYPDFIEHINLIIEQFGGRKHAIVFELTEQQAIYNLDHFTQNLNQLRNQGFQIALDDFGIGFANLQLLQRLKPDFIKLAGTFCRNVEEDKDKQIIIRATAKMAKRLSIPLIMENIETQKELKTIRELGVSYGQGYFFAKPQRGIALHKSTWFDKYPPKNNIYTE